MNMYVWEGYGQNKISPQQCLEIPDEVKSQSLLQRDEIDNSVTCSEANSKNT